MTPLASRGAGPQVTVHRAGDRFLTEAPGRRTRHSFSFAGHYDPANTGLGALVCHNDDVVEPGHGYPEHPHRDLEILTWVLQGALRHEDSSGHTGVVVPGQVQRLSAGSGVRHTEVNADLPGGGPVRFVQMWVRPDEPGLPPSYQQQLVDLPVGRWVDLASGRPHADAAVRLAAAGATLSTARLAPGDRLPLPDAPLLHVFAAVGAVRLEAGPDLGAGDAARLRGSGGAGVEAATPAEVLVWALDG